MLSGVDFERLLALDPSWNLLDIERLLPAGLTLSRAELQWLGRSIDRLVFGKASERQPPLMHLGVHSVCQRMEAMAREGTTFRSKFDLMLRLHEVGETATPRVITTAANSMGRTGLPTYAPGQPASAFVHGRPRLG